MISIVEKYGTIWIEQLKADVKNRYFTLAGWLVGWNFVPCAHPKVAGSIRHQGAYPGRGFDP